MQTIASPGRQQNAITVNESNAQLVAPLVQQLDEEAADNGRDRDDANFGTIAVVGDPPAAQTATIVPE